jgi:TrmH family RNA methyltransferase
VVITSKSNPRIQLARALAGRAKDRREEHAFVAEGVRLVEEAIASRWPLRCVLYSSDLNDRGRRLLAHLKDRGGQVDEVDHRLLASLSDTETSQGIVALLEESPIPLPASADAVLILDAIRDPGNVGTLIRTAEAAGVQAVLLARETADAFAPKVVRAGMGAHFRLPIQAMEWPEIRRFVAAQHMAAYLADMQGRSCWEVDLRKPMALIVGGEAEGASAEARSLAQESISIPMRGAVESLNAAVAGSVLLFEMLRQRQGRGS